MSWSKLRTGTLIALFIFLSLLAAASILPLLLQYRPVQQWVLGQVLDHYGIQNAKVSFSRANVVFWNPLEIQADDIKIWLPHEATTIRVGEISAKFVLPKLLKQDYLPESLSLNNLVLTFPPTRRSHIGSTASARILTSFLSLLSQVKHLSLLNSSIRFPSASLDLTKVYLRLASIPGKAFSTFRAIATLTKGHSITPVTMKGKVSVDPETGRPAIHALISAPHLLLSIISPLQEVNFTGGQAQAVLQIDGSPELLSYGATIKAVNPKFIMKSGHRRKLFHFSSLILELSGNYGRGKLSIPELHLRGPNFSLKGTLSYATRDKGGNINLKISVPWTDYITFRTIFPDPLVSPWLSEKLFPIISKGMVRVSQFTLKGSIDQLARLDRASNRSCLALKVLWKNLVALENKGPFEFADVSGALVISDGFLEINNLKGHYGKSVVSEASVRLPDIYGKSSKIFIQLKGLLDFSQLPKLAESPYAGAHIPRFLRDVSKARGLISLEVEGNWSASENTFIMDLGQFGPGSCSFRYNDLDVQIEEGSISFRAGFGYRMKGKVLLGNSSMKVVGWSNDRRSALSIHANGNAELTRLIRLLPCLSSLKISSHQAIKGDLSIMVASNLLTIECSADVGGVYIKPAQWVSITGQRGDILFVRLKKKLGSSGIAGQAILFQKQGFVASSFGYSPDTQLIQANIETPKARAEGLEVFLQADRYRIATGFSCDLKLKIPHNGLSHMSIFGTLQGYGLTISKQGPPTMFNNCQIGVEFQGSQIHINCMRTEVSGVPVFISGHLKGWNGLEGRLRVEMDQLDLASLMQISKRPAAPQAQPFPYGLPHNSDISINIKIDNTYYRALLLGALEATAVIRDGNIRLSQCKISSKHLKIALIGYLKSNPQPDYYIGVYIKGKNFPIQDLFRSAGSKTPLLEGGLTLEALLSSQGSHLKNLVKNLSGQANFSIAKGKIIKSTVLIKLLDFFSVQKIFIKKPPDLPKQGFYFEEIKGSVDVSNGVAHSDEVVMRSPVLNAILRGKVNLATGQIRADLGAQPFVTIDSILTRVPIVGYVLTGKERALLVYYFKVRGSIHEPKLTYVPLKNIGRSVLLFFRRAFFTPVRIFKNIKKFAKELSKRGKPLPAKELETPMH